MDQQLSELLSAARRAAPVRLSTLDLTANTELIADYVTDQMNQTKGLVDCTQESLNKQHT